MPRPEPQPATRRRLGKAADAGTHPAAPTAAPPPAMPPATPRPPKVQYSTRISLPVVERMNRWLETLPRGEQRGKVQELTERGLVLALNEVGAPV